MHYILKGNTVSFLESVHFFGGFWAHFPGVAVSKFKGASDAPLLIPLLLPLWAPLLDAATLLKSVLLPLWAPLLNAATPLSSFTWCCYTFEVFTATPLSFLFCYSFGLSLLLPLWDFPSSKTSSFQWKLEKNETWALGEPQLYNSEAMPLTYSVGCHDSVTVYVFHIGCEWVETGIWCTTAFIFAWQML